MCTEKTRCLQNTSNFLLAEYKFWNIFPIMWDSIRYSPMQHFHRINFFMNTFTSFKFFTLGVIVNTPAICHNLGMYVYVYLWSIQIKEYLFWDFHLTYLGFFFFTYFIYRTNNSLTKTLTPPSQSSRGMIRYIILF